MAILHNIYVQENTTYIIIIIYTYLTTLVLHTWRVPRRRLQNHTDLFVTGKILIIKWIKLLLLTLILSLIENTPMANGNGILSAVVCAGFTTIIVHIILLYRTLVFTNQFVWNLIRNHYYYYYCYIIMYLRPRTVLSILVCRQKLLLFYANCTVLFDQLYPHYNIKFHTLRLYVHVITTTINNNLLQRWHNNSNNNNNMYSLFFFFARFWKYDYIFLIRLYFNVWYKLLWVLKNYLYILTKHMSVWYGSLSKQSKCVKFNIQTSFIFTRNLECTLNDSWEQSPNKCLRIMKYSVRSFSWSLTFIWTRN